MKLLLLGADQNSLNLIGSTTAFYDLVGFRMVNFRNPKITKKAIDKLNMADYDLIVFPDTGVKNKQIVSLYDPNPILIPTILLQTVNSKTIVLTFHKTNELETMAHLTHTQVFSLEPTIYSFSSKSLFDSQAPLMEKKSLRRIEVLETNQKRMVNRLNHIFNKLCVNHVIAQYQPEVGINMTSFITTMTAIRTQVETESKLTDINYYFSNEQQNELVQQSLIKLYQQTKQQQTKIKTYQKTIRGYL